MIRNLLAQTCVGLPGNGRKYLGVLERTNLSKAYFVKGQIVAIAEAVLAGELSCIAAPRRLHGLGVRLFDEIDDDFIAFVALDSETDHLPIGIERATWDENALRRKDLEIAEIEAREKPSIDRACRVLIQRFKYVD